MKKYKVKLSEEEKAILENTIKKGKTSARRITRARILLLADEEKTDEEIAKLLRAGSATVKRVRKRLVKEGLEEALSEKTRPGRKHKLDGKEKAILAALACSEAPQGRQRWTMELLADKLVELKVVENISKETIRQTLKKTKLNSDKKTSVFKT